MRYPTYKGKFTPKHPEKYAGDVNNIIYRSGWERRVMKYLDEQPDVATWASEELIIPYVSPKDGLRHRYFPDFLVKKTDGSVQVLEVKPRKETKMPRKKKNQKQYVRELITYAVNKAKWEAAEAYCGRQGWNFVVLTEANLFGTEDK